MKDFTDPGFFRISTTNNLWFDLLQVPPAMPLDVIVNPKVSTCSPLRSVFVLLFVSVSIPTPLSVSVPIPVLVLAFVRDGCVSSSPPPVRQSGFPWDLHMDCFGDVDGNPISDVERPSSLAVGVCHGVCHQPFSHCGCRQDSSDSICPCQELC